MEIVRLDRKKGTSNRTVTQLLEDEMERWNSEKYKNDIPRKALILYLDDDNENYDISWAQAGMRMSGCVTLCELGKEKFKGEMGY